MLGEKDVFATIAVKDLATAKRFYEGKLGLTPAPSEEPSVQSYKSGASTIIIYQSQFAGTNKATAATWVVGADVEKIVQGLKTKGIAFEHYDFPGSTLKGDVHVSENMKAAWFKDPDGNFLAIVSG